MHQHPPSVRPETSVLAILALVFSVLCAPVGVVLAIIALVQIHNSDGRLTGKTMAIIAIVIPGLFFTLGIVAAISFPNFIRYQLRSKTKQAEVNLLRIRDGMDAYLAANGRYIRIEPTPPNLPGFSKTAWPVTPCTGDCDSVPSGCASFECISFRPPHGVYYSYACEVSDDGLDYACAAIGDLDGDGQLGMFVYGTGQDVFGAPIPDFGGHAPRCFGVRPNVVFDCQPGKY